MTEITENDIDDARSLLAAIDGCVCRACLRVVAIALVAERSRVRAPLESDRRALEARVQDLMRERDAAWKEAADERLASARFADAARTTIENLRAEVASLRGTARSHDD